MFGAERPTLLGDLRDIRTSIVDPGSLGPWPLSEEEDVSLRPFRVRAEGAPWAAQYGVDIAVLHQDLEDFAGLVSE